MISLCVFDMGGVLVRDFNVQPALLSFLGRKEKKIAEIHPDVAKALRDYGMGHIGEDEIWQCYTRATGETLPVEVLKESLVGKFFTPYIDEATLTVLRELKKTGMRVVCGTNVNDSHYTIHQQLKQYDIFDTVYASHLIHRSKPDTDFFEYILNAENKKPREVFFTDDFPENCAAADSLGILTQLYTSAENLHAKLCELQVL